MNDELLYDRKNPPPIDKSVADVRTVVHLADELRGKLLAALEAATSAAVR